MSSWKRNILKEPNPADLKTSHPSTFSKQIFILKQSQQVLVRSAKESNIDQQQKRRHTPMENMNSWHTSVLRYYFRKYKLKIISTVTSRPPGGTSKSTKSAPAKKKREREREEPPDQRSNRYVRIWNAFLYQLWICKNCFSDGITNRQREKETFEEGIACCVRWGKFYINSIWRWEERESLNNCD